jgi:EF-P beta-lysylation protein EpmB
MKPRIIPVATSVRQPDDWQRILREAVRDGATLLDRLGLGDHPLRERIDAMPEFRVLVPAPFLARMTPGDPDDPLLRQVLAVQDERREVPGYVPDPLAEAGFERAPGLLQKYAGRALLLAATACAVNCRYCFRRACPYDAHQGAWRLPEPVRHALASDPELHEVILSGGDPLLLNDDALAELLEQLAAIPHLRTLRIHTRLPVVIPSRVTTALAGMLAATRLRCVLVLHVNHAREIDDELEAALGSLRAAGVTLLNQSVLLHGVNDDVASLQALSERLFAAHVLPYYLHLLDPVVGAAHFDVPEPAALALHGQLRARLPGYLVPRLVREIPGRAAKTVLA